VEVVDVWTGRRASALRTALRLTNETFADQLGTAVRTVAKWNSQADLVPTPELQRALVRK
jgi:DNA-binding transcriptional regulator YiaG